MTSPAFDRRRPLWTVVVFLLLGAAALWGSSRLTWFAEYRDAGVRGVVLDTRTGAQEAGALAPLAVLALAGVAGMAATGGWPRRVLGGVLVVAGLAACWLAVDGVSFGGPETPAILVGRGLAVVAGILVLAGGLVGFKGAARMPRLGARYSVPSVQKTARDPGTELWDALSEGEDPTTGR